jgi:hypothetical protein
LSPERQRTGRWIYYKTYEMKAAALEGKEAGGRGVDMVMVHGEPFLDNLLSPSSSVLNAITFQA